MKKKQDNHAGKIIVSNLNLGLCLGILCLLSVGCHLVTEKATRRTEAYEMICSAPEEIRSAPRQSGVDGEIIHDLEESLSEGSMYEESSKIEVPRVDPSMEEATEVETSQMGIPKEETFQEECQIVEPSTEEPSIAEPSTEETSIADPSPEEPSMEETPKEGSVVENSSIEGSEIEETFEGNHVHTLGPETDPFGNGTLIRQTCIECGAWMQKTAIVEEIYYDTVYWTDAEGRECTQIFYDSEEREAFRSSLFEQGIPSGFMTNQIEYRIVDWTVSYSDTY